MHMQFGICNTFRYDIKQNKTLYCRRFHCVFLSGGRIYLHRFFDYVAN